MSSRSSAHQHTSSRSSAHQHTSMSSVHTMADGVYDALMRDDIPRAMHLSWLLMQQPHCPLQLQAQAVLVHSASSLTLGGDADIIENNLQSMIKRLGNTISRLAAPAQEAPWAIKSLGQLRGALTALRNSRKSSKYRPYPSKHRMGDLDSLVEGFGKMGLGCLRDNVVIHEEAPVPLHPWRQSRA